MFGWAPFELWPIALGAYGTLFWLLRRSRSSLEAAAVAASFALGLHIAGHGWMFATLQHRVGLGMGMALTGMALYLGYLMAFTVVPAAAFSWLNRRVGTDKRWFATNLVLSFAAFMTLGEWARSLTFNGFTSLSLGYVFVGSPFNGFAPIGGLYLSSFAGYAVAALLAEALVRARHGQGAWRVAVALAPSAAGVALLAILAWQCARIEWSGPNGAPLGYRLIQSNVAQHQKFDRQYIANHTRHLTDLVTAAPATIVCDL